MTLTYKLALNIHLTSLPKGEHISAYLARRASRTQTHTHKCFKTVTPSQVLKQDVMNRLAVYSYLTRYAYG